MAHRSAPFATVSARSPVWHADAAALDRRRLEGPHEKRNSDVTLEGASFHAGGSGFLNHDSVFEVPKKRRLLAHVLANNARLGLGGPHGHELRHWPPRTCQVPGATDVFAEQCATSSTPELASPKAQRRPRSVALSCVGGRGESERRLAARQATIKRCASAPDGGLPKLKHQLFRGRVCWGDWIV